MRRDPATKADGRTDHEALRAERDAESERDLRLGRAEHQTAADEVTNRGRREVQIAGGNGEQRSRERARIKSEEDPTGKQPPFHKHDAPTTTPRHVGPEQAIADDERTTLPRGLSPERTSAPMSQSGARITDFE